MTIEIGLMFFSLDVLAVFVNSGHIFWMYIYKYLRWQKKKK